MERESANLERLLSHLHGLTQALQPCKALKLRGPRLKRLLTASFLAFGLWYGLRLRLPADAKKAGSDTYGTIVFEVAIEVAIEVEVF